MKWIKYQILQNVIDEEEILIEKKVGYNDANLAIAQKEAHNGQYEIIEDEEVIETKPLAVELGGTGGRTAKEARANLGLDDINVEGLQYRGVCPLTSANEDTPAFWRNLGTGMWSVTDTSVLKNMQFDYAGMLLNFVYVEPEEGEKEISQLYITSGEIYSRMVYYSKRHPEYLTEWQSDNDGRWNKFHMNFKYPLQSGDYVGTNESGVDNPVEIHLDREPEFFFVTDGANAMFWVYGMETMLWIRQTDESGGAGAYVNEYDSDNNVFSFYADFPAACMNEPGYYCYIAIY